MTNRDKYLLRKNEYDVLCGIQKVLLEGCVCIIDALTCGMYPCSHNCEECIQEWLNKEAN